MKTITVMFTNVFLLVVLFIIVACNTKISESKLSNNNVESSTKINSPSIDIFTAALTGNVKVIKQHISIGTDLNKEDKYGSSPLSIAATFGKTDAAIALIEAGAELNNQNKDGSTPLHTAAFFCRTEIVEALLNNGANKTIKNGFGSTALQSLLVPFENVKPFYDQISKDLGPLGFKLDYEHIKVTRPVIADMLQQ